MTNASTGTMKNESTNEAKVFTKEDVRDALAVIAEKIVEPHAAFAHAVLFLDRLLRSPAASEIFDEDLKTQARDLWLKVKSTGFQLADPPFLFGTPLGGDGQPVN